MLRHFIILIYLSVSQEIEFEGSPCSHEGIQGQCVSVFRCLTSVKNIEAKKYPPTCGFDDKTPLICCTDCELVNDTRLYLFNSHLGLLNKTGTNKAKDKCLEYIHTLDYPCKKLLTPLSYVTLLDPDRNCTNQIVVRPNGGGSGYAAGGRSAVRQEYPHMLRAHHSCYLNGSQFGSCNFCLDPTESQCLEYIHALDYPCKKRLTRMRYVVLLDPDRNCTKQIRIRSYKKHGGHAAGGRKALRQEYPHMALLGYGEDINNASWLCGGTVISEKFILTAAHCLYGPNVGPVKYISLGILKRSDPDSLWQRYDVKNAIPHPEYKPPYKYNDIALLETDREIDFNHNVRPACLHTDDVVDAYAAATGWGALGHRQDLADILQSVILHQFTKEECSQSYPSHRNLLNGYDHASQMCYGDRQDTRIPTDTCEGDSGGPLQSESHEICVYTVLGVTSFGRQCGLSGGTGMYTRVSHYVPWIESIVWP